MKFVKTIKVSDHQTMVIYEISSDLAKKYGGQFVLSRGEFSDFALREFGEEKLLNDIHPGYYEGFFQTEKEAYLSAKLVAASHELKRIKAAIDNMKNLEVQDIRW